MMDVEERLSLVLAELYDKTGRPEEWPALLESLVAYVGGRAGQVIIGDTNQPETVVFGLAGLDPELFKRYVDHFAWNDPRHAAHLSQVGIIRRDDEGIDREAFERTDLVRGLLDPAGVRHGLGSYIAAHGSKVVSVAALRPRAEGPFTDEELRRFALLLPHLKRSFELHARLDDEAVRANGTEALLALMATGVLLVDGSCRIIVANPAAQAILSRADGLLARSGTVVARASRDTDRLGRLVANAARAMTGAEPLGAAGTVLAGRRDGAEAYQVLVCPLARSHPLLRLGPAIEVALLITDPERKQRSGAEIFTAAFGLTPAEARLAQYLAQGDSLAEAAERFGVSITTVRTQLQRLFDKTDTHRQGELVRLLQARRTIALG